MGIWKSSVPAVDMRLRVLIDAPLHMALVLPSSTCHESFAPCTHAHIVIGACV